MDSTILTRAFFYAFVLHIKILLLYGIYLLSQIASNQQRSAMNPPWSERIIFLFKGLGVLAIIVTIFVVLFESGTDDNGETSRFNPWLFSVIYLSALPALCLGLNKGFTEKEQLSRHSATRHGGYD